MLVLNFNDVPCAFGSKAHAGLMYRCDMGASQNRVTPGTPRTYRGISALQGTI